MCVCVAKLPHSIRSLALTLTRSLSLSPPVLVFMKNYKSASQLKYFRLSRQQCAIENSYLAIGICPEICNGNWAIGQAGNQANQATRQRRHRGSKPDDKLNVACGSTTALGHRIDDTHVGHMWILCACACRGLLRTANCQLPTVLASTQNLHI